MSTLLQDYSLVKIQGSYFLPQCVMLRKRVISQFITDAIEQHCVQM